MARSVQVSLPPARADALVARLRDTEGVVGLSLARGGSLSPPGDVIGVQTTNDGLRGVLRVLTEMDVARDGAFAISELTDLVAAGCGRATADDGDPILFDEAVAQLRDTSNPTPVYLALMGLSGALAAAGLWSNELLLILAAQLLGPHLEPLLRLAMGVVVRSRSLFAGGLKAVLAGYATLVAGAAGSYWLLRALDRSHTGDLHTRGLVHQFSTISPTAPLVAGLAAVAAAVVLLSRRTLLLSGVYLALALVPGMALVGAALASGDGALALRALGRWSLDAGAVIVLGGLVLAGAQATVLRRDPIVEPAPG